MRIAGWGNYPVAQADIFRPAGLADLSKLIATNNSLTPRGFGRSYGDSAIGNTVLETANLDALLGFDANTGVVTASAGVSLAELIRLFLPRGWFLPVTPGTRHVSVGGAIAADVHGKNHHVDGSFSDHVLELEVMLGNGDILRCSRQEHPALFYATCGGMGLTGVILSAVIQLRKVGSSNILQHSVKAANLSEILDLFAATSESTYSVAWIDCMASGRKLGRSILLLGEHADDGEYKIGRDLAPNIPFNLPKLVMNAATMKSFNTLYYHKQLTRHKHSLIGYQPYFYPLDAVKNWGRLYGKPGFFQYQFVLPAATAHTGLPKILQTIADSNLGSALAVLKVFGAANDNLLSFPTAGYTLALDFQISAKALELATQLDQLVIEYGGRLYLAKDSRMTAQTFRAGYGRWEEFQQVRSQYYALGKFTSAQSIRLGLD